MCVYPILCGVGTGILALLVQVGQHGDDDDVGDDHDDGDCDGGNGSFFLFHCRLVNMVMVRIVVIMMMMVIMMMIVIVV